jgi:hypothetical protein
MSADLGTGVELVPKRQDQEVPEVRFAFRAGGDASSTDAGVRLRRHRTSGVLSERSGRAACVSEDGSGPCADGHALLGAFGVAASPDGRSAYVASLDSAAVARFKWSHH